MIVIVYKYLTPRGYKGVTFFPFVILSNGNDALNQGVYQSWKNTFETTIGVIDFAFLYLVFFWIYDSTSAI